MFQGLAIQKLHCNEGRAVLLINLVDSADAWMIQCRGSLRLTLEANKCLGVFGQLLRQELQSNKAMELDVLSLVNDTHATAAQLL